jgi:hypothetical protein
LTDAERRAKSKPKEEDTITIDDPGQPPE